MVRRSQNPHAGRKVLAALKADPELGAVPVVMVTLSPTEDLNYVLGSADNLMKPLDHERPFVVLRRLGSLRDQSGVLIITTTTPPERNAEAAGAGRLERRGGGA